MIEFGLISGAGYLVNKHGLSRWASGIAWAKGGATREGAEEARP